ncbi:MAG: sugar MFS transporter [Terracidiphilus sp.]|jgi:FHS family L-fucose permease-like MFS transporter
MASRSTPPTVQSAPNYTVPFIIVAALFGIFGFLTSLNNQLVGKLKETFTLGYGQAMLATAAWFLAYLVFSVPSGKLIERVGYKKTMVISLFIMVLGALAFIPAAMSVSFPLTLGAIFLLATGVCALQTSANPYAAILGPEHSAALRVNLAQAFNSGASALAPVVAAAFILSGVDKVGTATEQAHMLITPYIVIAAALFVLGFIVMGLHLPTVNLTRDFRPSDLNALNKRSIWSYPHVVLGMIGIFFYVGLEISLAAIGVRFAEEQGVSDLKIAGFMVTAYYLLIMIGRFAGSALMTKIKPEKLLVGLGIFGIVLMVAGMLVSGSAAVACLVFCGLANSIMYPTIFALGIAELGPMTSEGSGVITIGNVGGAAIPPLFGLIADHMGIQRAFLLVIVCYVFIVYYGLSGYKPARKAAA